jgi:transposase
MDRRIEAMVRETGTSLTTIPGVGCSSQRRSRGRWGSLQGPVQGRLRRRVRDDAPSRLLGAAPPAPPEPGGNRQLTWALHYVALVLCRIMPEAQADMVRQREAGKSHKEAMRCRKRHLSSVVHRHLLAEARGVELAV